MLKSHRKILRKHINIWLSLESLKSLLWNGEKIIPSHWQIAKLWPFVWHYVFMLQICTIGTVRDTWELRNTVRPNKKETRLISEISSLSHKIETNYILQCQEYFVLFHLVPNTLWYLKARMKRNNLNSRMSKTICAE